MPLELPLYPFLSAADFAALCTAFADRQARLPRPQKWSLVDEPGYGRYLCLRRHTPLRGAESPQDEPPPPDVSQHENEAEDADEEEEDPESLPVRARAAGDPGATEVEYNILYSPTYRLPVLYFAPAAPLEPAQLCELLRLRAAAWAGTVTQGESLRNGEAWWFVHPCRTGEAMEEWRGVLAAGAGEGGARGEHYLDVWLGIVGGVAGLR